MNLLNVRESALWINLQAHESLLDGLKTYTTQKRLNIDHFIKDLEHLANNSKKLPALKFTGIQKHKPISKSQEHRICQLGLQILFGKRILNTAWEWDAETAQLIADTVKSYPEKIIFLTEIESKEKFLAYLQTVKHPNSQQLKAFKEKINEKKDIDFILQGMEERDQIIVDETIKSLKESLEPHQIAGVLKKTRYLMEKCDLKKKNGRSIDNILRYMMQIFPNENDGRENECRLQKISSIFETKTYVDAIDMNILLRSIAGIPLDEIEDVIEKGMPLFNQDKSSTYVGKILEAVSKIPLKERKDITLRAKSLFDKTMDSQQKLEILTAIKEILPDEREEVISNAQTLFDVKENGFDKAPILRIITGISKDQRNDVISKAKLVFAGPIGGLSNQWGRRAEKERF
jgi:hypothetical protein